MKKYLIILVIFSSFSCENDTPEPLPNPKEYSLTLNINPVGAGILSESSGVYEENKSLSILATANENYNFDGWTGSIISSDNPLSVKMDSDKTITANFVELCELDYTSLFNGVNKNTSHYQPMNIPFFDPENAIQYYTGQTNTDQIWHQHLNLNGNDIPDNIVILLDHNTTENGTAYVFVDQGLAYTFDTTLDALRQIEVGDLDGDGFDDVLMVSTGIDREPYTGDPVVVAYLSTNSYSLATLDSTPSYRHAGALGDIDGDGDLDALMNDNLQFQDNNGMISSKWYENRGRDNWAVRSTNIPNIVNQGLTQLELIDFDNDGILDLFVGGAEWRADWYELTGLPETQNENTRILIGQGEGQFYWDQPILIPRVEGWGKITDLDAYDLDNDGTLELIVTRTGGLGQFYYVDFKLQILKGSPAIGYTTSTLLDSPPNLWDGMWVYNTMIYDVNKDCILDIVPENDRTIVDAYFEGTSNFEYVLKYKE